MMIKTTKATNGKGLLINADKVNTIEPTATAVRVTFENGETVDVLADFSHLQNMLGGIVVPDGAYPD